MSIKANEIQIVGVNELIPHPKNMHEHSDDQIDRLIKLVEYQGFRNPLVVQKGTNLIVAGHGRLMAAKKMGLESVPVSYQEFESEEQIYAYMVSDNAIGKDTWASLDLSKINSEIENLGPELDIDLLGLKDFVIEPMEKFTEPDYSVLDDVDFSDSEIRKGCKKAIMVEFTPEDYDLAYPIFKNAKDKGFNIGLLMIEKLRDLND